MLTADCHWSARRHVSVADEAEYLSITIQSSLSHLGLGVN